MEGIEDLSRSQYPHQHPLYSASMYMYHAVNPVARAPCVDTRSFPWRCNATGCTALRYSACISCFKSWNRRIPILPRHSLLGHDTLDLTTQTLSHSQRALLLEFVFLLVQSVLYLETREAAVWRRCGSIYWWWVCSLARSLSPDLRLQSHQWSSYPIFTWPICGILITFESHRLPQDSAIAPCGRVVNANCNSTDINLAARWSLLTPEAKSSIGMSTFHSLWQLQSIQSNSFIDTPSQKRLTSRDNWTTAAM